MSGRVLLLCLDPMSDVVQTLIVDRLTNVLNGSLGVGRGDDLVLPALGSRSRLLFTFVYKNIHVNSK